MAKLFPRVQSMKSFAAQSSCACLNVFRLASFNLSPAGHICPHPHRYDYKIQYNDISKLFLLEKPDERYVAFVVSLDKPIRQGQQKYQHLVLRTTKV